MTALANVLAEEVVRLRGALFEIRNLHWPLVSGCDAGFCNGCDYSWPCPSERIAAAALEETEK